MTQPATDQNAHLQRLIEWCSEAHEPLVIAFQRFPLFAIVATLQLARRHPNFPPYLAGEIDRAIRDLQSLMPEDIRAIAELGSDPAHDVPVEGSWGE